MLSKLSQTIENLPLEGFVLWVLITITMICVMSVVYIEYVEHCRRKEQEDKIQEALNRGRLTE